MSFRKTVLASARSLLGTHLYIKSHRARVRFAILATLALFIAQLGAIGHSYAHERAAATVASQELPKAHEYCADCLNFAPLLAPAYSPAILTPILLGVQASGPDDVTAKGLAHRTYLAFRSRAPPVTR